MKIGLLGFVTDDANKGCEALTYSFIQLLIEIVKEPLEVVCYVPVEGKCNRLAAYFSDIKVTDKRLKIKDIHLSSIKELKSCDFIFDVTCGDGFSDIYFPKQVIYTTIIKELAIISGTPLILLPQTYGPFSDKKIEKFAMHVIKKSRRVYSRDQKSTDYINSYLKNKDILTVTDLAFLLPYERNDDIVQEGCNVGLNVSGLLWNGGFTDNNQFGLTVDYKKYIEKVIEQLHEKGYLVHLIPHVIENMQDSIDGDVGVCKLLKEKYPFVKLAPDFQNPIEAKSYISAMDAFIGARMHSTIGALSAEIPVIPFSYSRKFEGLYDNLNYPYMIHGKEMETKAAIEQTLYYVENRETLKEAVMQAKRHIDKNISTFIRDLKMVMNQEVQNGKSIS